MQLRGSVLVRFPLNRSERWKDDRTNLFLINIQQPQSGCPLPIVYSKTVLQRHR